VNRNDLMHLMAERTALTRMIAETPEEDVIDRASLSIRLEKVERQIKANPLPEREPARAVLTFKGKPVVGSHGIFAAFGMKAVNHFTEAVAAVAASLDGGLAAKGPIPNKGQNQLLITNTALGSFGFELEEHPGATLAQGGQSMLGTALERTQNLLQGTINPDDELLADSAAGLDQRALDRVRTFVNTLDESEAVCALQIGDRVFRFSDLIQVQRSLARISQDNLREEEVLQAGQFVGVMPAKKREFEFQLQGNDEVIVGKIGPNITNPAELTTHLCESVLVKLVSTRVGNGKPRYVLTEMPEWTAGSVVM
jgi:hypothetical protein